MTSTLERYSTLTNQSWSQDAADIATQLAQDLSQTVQERDAIAGIPDQEAQCLRASGLLPLMVPKAYGGLGGSWLEAINIVKILAKAARSAAQLSG